MCLYIHSQSKAANEDGDSEEGAGKGLADLRDKIRNLQVQVSRIVVRIAVVNILLSIWVVYVYSSLRFISVCLCMYVLCIVVEDAACPGVADDELRAGEPAAGDAA